VALFQGDRSLQVLISEDLLCFVRSLTYASFHDSDEVASLEDAKPLEPWQVSHATAILKQSDELESLRYVLCPKCVFPVK
jgi:hypothetical protein